VLDISGLGTHVACRQSRSSAAAAGDDGFGRWVVQHGPMTYAGAIEIVGQYGCGPEARSCPY